MTSAAQLLVTDSARIEATRAAEFAIAAKTHDSLQAATQSTDQAPAAREVAASAAAPTTPAFEETDPALAATADQAFQTQAENPEDVSWSAYTR